MRIRAKSSKISLQFLTAEAKILKIDTQAAILKLDHRISRGSKVDTKMLLNALISVLREHLKSLIFVKMF